jgi:hypothetical protein
VTFLKWVIYSVFESLSTVKDAIMINDLLLDCSVDMEDGVDRWRYIRTINKTMDETRNANASYV